MNFSQLHERLRLELLRRIERGVLSGALLARQTGFRQAHISNFLHRKRSLSLGGLDRILAAQMLSVTDLVQLDDLYAKGARREPKAQSGALTSVPIVSQAAAIHEPHPSAQAAVGSLQVPSRVLEHLRSRRAASRRDWTRFVAVRVTPQQAAGMDPVLVPDAIAFIDRHYNALVSYRALHPSLFAVRAGNNLLLRYVSFELNRLILRPYNLTHPVHLLALAPHEMPSDLLVGRVFLTLSEL